jgi:DNA-binding response OmpR family regulator
MLKILVVDDEPDICSLISDALVEEGHEVTCAPSRLARRETRQKISPAAK